MGELCRVVMQVRQVDMLWGMVGLLLMLQHFILVLEEEGVDIMEEEGETILVK